MAGNLPGDTSDSDVDSANGDPADERPSAREYVGYYELRQALARLVAASNNIKDLRGALREARRVLSQTGVRR